MIRVMIEIMAAAVLISAAEMAIIIAVLGIYDVIEERRGKR